MWRPICFSKVSIKPIYEITETGDIRRLGNSRCLPGNRVYLELVDGSHKHFFRNELTATTFAGMHLSIMDDETHVVMERIQKFAKLYTNEEIDVYQHNLIDNMFIITSPKFRYPISVQKVEIGKNVTWVVRSGIRYDDITYFPTKDVTHSYAEATSVRGLIKIIDHKIARSIINDRVARHKAKVQMEAEELMV